MEKTPVVLDLVSPIACHEASQEFGVEVTGRLPVLWVDGSILIRMFLLTFSAAGPVAVY